MIVLAFNIVLLKLVYSAISSMTIKVLPPIRACLFDLDGLLLNTEDIYTDCINETSLSHGGAPIPIALRAAITGTTDGFKSDIFLNWARETVPSSTELFLAEIKTLMGERMSQTTFLPGAEAMVRALTRSARVHRVVREKEVLDPVVMAVVSSTKRKKFEQKTRRHGAVFDLVPPALTFCGDDANIPPHVRPKPAPDRYILALEMINERNALLQPGRVPDLIKPAECLVFEDSIVGVEAARRAGMRVIWVPSRGVREVFKEWEEEILQGRFSTKGGTSAAPNESLARRPDLERLDGWALSSDSLVGIDFSSYGIIINPEDPTG